jgi:hypothetical protein
MTAPVQKMFVKPKVPGTTVRQIDHDMQPLPQGGAWVVASSFWQSRLLNGDVIEAEPPSEIISDEMRRRAESAARDK